MKQDFVLINICIKNITLRQYSLIETKLVSLHAMELQ